MIFKYFVTFSKNFLQFWRNLILLKRKALQKKLTFLIKYILSQKILCTQKKSSDNQETRHECSLARDMQMTKILTPDQTRLSS